MRSNIAAITDNANKTPSAIVAESDSPLFPEVEHTPAIWKSHVPFAFKLNR